VVLAGVGALVGGALAVTTASGGRWQSWWGRFGWAVKLPATAGWVLVLAWRRWSPFELDWPGGAGSQSWADLAASAGRVFDKPLMDIARTAGPLDAAARLGGEFASLLVLGLLLQSLLAREGGLSRWAAAVAATVCAGILLEAGRLVFLHVHNPDLTVLLAGVAGSAASAWAYRKIVRMVRPQNAEGSHAMIARNAADSDKAE
jgi:hypothetical protein